MKLVVVLSLSEDGVEECGGDKVTQAWHSSLVASDAAVTDFSVASLDMPKNSLMLGASF